MARILTMTLNPAIDTTYVVDGLTLGKVHRVREKLEVPGGKGNNVAKVLAIRGHDVSATGFVAGTTGRWITNALPEWNVRSQYIDLAHGESRICISIIDDNASGATELLESGPEVTSADYDRLIAALPDMLANVDAVTISGSGPKGTTAEDLKRLSRAIREHASLYVVDSSGWMLEALLAGTPDIIKPNEDELVDLMGGSPTHEEQVEFARTSLLPRLADGGRVAISRGGDGATLITATHTTEGTPPEIELVNTVGCGDAFVAGLTEAICAGASDEEALANAMAFGAAAAFEPVPGRINPARVDPTTVEIHSETI